MKRQISEHRVLSLASSLVFLLSFALSFYAVAGLPPSPFFSFLTEHWIPLIFVPVLVPCIALARLFHLRFVKKMDIPFFDGWFIHLVILLPYAIMVPVMYPLSKMA